MFRLSTTAGGLGRAHGRAGFALAAACVGAVLAGCEGMKLGRSEQAAPPAPRRIPPGIAGTVAEYADLVGGGEMVVRGYGVVIGLGQSGSSEVPTGLRKYLTDQMLKAGLGSPQTGTGPLTPGHMLADKDTAVVGVTGRVPPAAPVGTRFDVFIEALDQTQTVSLDGGMLLGTDLRISLPGPMSDFGKAKSWGLAKGAVFVNPFAKREDKDLQARLRQGLIPGGGAVTRERPVRLELRRPDYRIASVIQRRINERFGQGRKLAVAKTPAMIELKIPEEYREEYRHYLELVMHLGLTGGAGADERQAKQLARAMVLPTARHEDIALSWEAMGRQVALPVVRELYASENVAAAFYASRTGLRLEDAQAVDAMLRLAQRADPTFQEPAIRALGKARKFLQCVPTLRQLLSGPNELVRVAAYEALLDHGSTGAIRRESVSGQFTLDVVEADRDYVIYATRTDKPKIVLFGTMMPVQRPVFYCPEDELVTINAAADKTRLTVFRKVPRSEGTSDSFDVTPLVTDLVRTLGRAPKRNVDGEIEGLGLTYSQVVGVLYGLCQAHHVPARFVLQRSPEVQKIYSSISAAGRPDMPEEDGE